jgi:hypothetical protein
VLGRRFPVKTLGKSTLIFDLSLKPFLSAYFSQNMKNDSWLRFAR